MAVLNFKPLINLCRTICPYEIAEALAMEGIDKIDGLGIGTCLEKGGSKDTVFVHCPGEKKGLLKALAPHPISWDQISRVPPQALYFMDIVFDPQLILEEIDQFVCKVVPEAYEDFQCGLREVKAETGFDLQHDIFEPLGSELTFWVTMPQGGGMAMIPDMIATMSLDDEKRFGTLLEKLIGMLEEEVDFVSTPYNDLTIRHLIIPGAPITPAFMVNNEKLFVAGSPMTLMNYLQWLKKGEPGLDQNEAFQAAVMDVPASASMFEYVNVKQGVEIGYGIAMPFLPALLAEAELPLNVGLLPMTETVAKYFSSLSYYVAQDKDGIVLSGRSSFGMGVMLAVCVDLIDHLAEKGMLQGALQQVAQLDQPDGDPLLTGAYGLRAASSSKSPKLCSPNGWTKILPDQKRV